MYHRYLVLRRHMQVQKYAGTTVNSWVPDYLLMECKVWVRMCTFENFVLNVAIHDILQPL